MIVSSPNVPSDAQERGAMRTFYTPEKIQHTIPNLKGEVREHYVVEWGGRITDGALVFHFFPPLTAQGNIGKWPHDSTMDKRLEVAMPAIFDTARLTAGFETDWDAFYVIGNGYASSLDPRLLAKRFLDAIDAA